MPSRAVPVLVRFVGAGCAAVLLALASVGLSRADDGPGSATSASVSTPEAAPAPRDATRPSGLRWSSGVFSHDASRSARFARDRGRPLDVLAVFPTRDSWDSLLDPWWMSPSAVPDGFAGTLAVGLPLFPGDSSYEAAARGEHDDRWREMGALIASRHPDAWVRIGWEMNIPNWPWAVTPENAEQYRQAFRHAALALKQGGPGLRVVFNPNEGRGGSLPDARLAYPGDDVVDDIGIDAYDWYPAYSSGGWEEHRTKDQGWDFWAAFAREHGKTFSVPEWGVMSGSDASGGDNPEYIDAVLGWMHENADVMSFDAYFEETEPYCRCALSQNPRARAAYLAALVGPAGDSPGAPSAHPDVGGSTPRPRPAPAVVVLRFGNSDIPLDHSGPTEAATVAESPARTSHATPRE